MSPADLDRVLEIAARLKPASQWPRSAYLAALDSEAAPRRIALVAETSETEASAATDRSSSPAGRLVAGFIVASLLPPQSELEIIAVAPQFQRRGLARRLFTALAAELRTGQPVDLLLELRASNLPALAFYRSLGFTETGRRPRYYHDPIEDALQMRRRLE
jgi:ribosomal protein S18 acetylase RimI-like enzyme